MGQLEELVEENKRLKAEIAERKISDAVRQRGTTGATTEP
jgi:hypothetical protein